MSFIAVAFSAAAKDIGGMISATLGLVGLYGPRLVQHPIHSRRIGVPNLFYRFLHNRLELWLGSKYEG